MGSCSGTAADIVLRVGDGCFSLSVDTGGQYLLPTATSMLLVRSYQLGRVDVEGRIVHILLVCRVCTAIRTGRKAARKPAFAQDVHLQCCMSLFCEYREHPCCTQVGLWVSEHTTCLCTGGCVQHVCLWIPEDDCCSLQ